MAGLQTILLLGVFSLPGCLLWLLLQSPSEDRTNSKAPGIFAFLLTSFFIGYLVLTFLFYFLSITLNWGFSIGSFTILSAAVTLPLAVAGKRSGRLRFPSLGPDRYMDLAAFAATALVGYIYYRNHSLNQIVSTFCLKENIRLLIDPSSEPGYLLRHIVGDQREGGPAYAGGLIAFFPYSPIGPRMVFAFCGLSIAAFSHLTTRTIVKKEWIALVLLFVASLHPYLFRIRGIDENVISLSVSSFLIYLLFLKQKAHLPLIGFVAAYLFNVRHENILFLVAMVFFVVRYHSPRALPRLLIPFGLFLLPTFYRHWSAMGDLLAYESFIQHREPFEHEFLGFTFHLKTLLNFPFHPEVIRTPFNPYPNFLQWPLYLARYSGYAFCIVTLLGLTYGWRKDKSLLLFTGLWIAPTYLLLSLLEHWDYPSKMSIVLVLFNGFYLLVAGGLESLGEMRIRASHVTRLALVTIMVPAVILGLNSIPTTSFPVDSRYMARNPCVRKEHPRHIAIQKVWMRQVGVLPVKELSEIFRRTLRRTVTDASLSRTKVQSWYSERTLEWITHERDGPRQEGSLLLNIQRNPVFPEAWIESAKELGSSKDIIVLDMGLPKISPLSVECKWDTWPVLIEFMYSREDATLRIKLMSYCDPDRLYIFCAHCPCVWLRDKDVFTHPHRVVDGSEGKTTGIVLRVEFPVWVVIQDYVNIGADVVFTTEGRLDSKGFHPVGTVKTVTN